MNTEKRWNGFKNRANIDVVDIQQTRGWEGEDWRNMQDTNRAENIYTFKQGVFEDDNDTWAALAVLSTPMITWVNGQYQLRSIKLKMYKNKATHMRFINFQVC